METPFQTSANKYCSQCPRFFRDVIVRTDSGRQDTLEGLKREPEVMSRDYPEPGGDYSQIGFMISSLLETSAVARGRHRGGSNPQGIGNEDILWSCLRCAQFATGMLCRRTSGGP